MNKIDELIHQYCPDGVEYKSLDRCCNILDNKRKPITKAARTSGEYPYYGANGIQDYVDGYIFEGEFVLVGEDGSVITANGNPVVTWAEGKIWVNNHAHIISEIEGVILRYLYYYIQTINVTPLIHGNIPKLTGGDFKTLEIPIPPLPVQEEIVRVLDKFTELVAKLETELELRKIQREGIKQRLFDFGNKAKWVVAEKICDIEKGNTPIQKAIEGEYPLVVTTVERKTSNTYQFDRAAVCIPLVSSRGHGIASLNHVYYQEGKFALGNILCALMPKNTEELDGRFLYQYLEYSKDYVLVPLMKGGANVAMHKEDIKGIKIPLIDLEIQKDIVKKIQACDEIIDLISEEIVLRKKQYEYYMNLFLSFNRA